jgi:hypothetical protein
MSAFDFASLHVRSFASGRRPVESSPQSGVEYSNRPKRLDIAGKGDRDNSCTLI